MMSIRHRRGSGPAPDTGAHGGPVDGRCVSCGREPGRFYRVCPYCGERVWRPGWRRAAAGLVAAGMPLLAALLAWRARPDVAACARSLGEGAAAWAGWLFASGVGLLALPCDDGDRVASSRRELAGWQARGVGGSLACGAAAAVAALCLKDAAAPDPLSLAAAAALAACVAAAPLVFWVPWRAVAGAALVAAGLWAA